MVDHAPLGAAAAALLLVAACGGAKQKPMTTDAYVAAAQRICDDGQQKVYAAQTSELKGASDTFPSPALVSFYQKTHAFGLDVIAQLRSLPVPAGQEQRRDADLALIGSQIDFTAAAGAAAGSDQAAYRRAVAGKRPAPQPNPLLPPACLNLSLGPGAGN
jgi:hypothetical protein